MGRIPPAATNSSFSKSMSKSRSRPLSQKYCPPSPTSLLTLTFDLLTWKSIGIIYSSRTIYLPSLKLLGQSLLELSVAQGWGRPTYWQTDRQTDRHVQCNLPLLFQRGGGGGINMKAPSLLVQKLWQMLSFFKSRSNVKVKVTKSKILVSIESFGTRNTLV